MKRPSFQFYPADWKANAKLRRCSDAARGAWMDVLCLLHDSDEYGVIRWPLADIARAAGVPLKLVKELASKDVFKGCDKGISGFEFTPRHAGKDGDPVTLIEQTDQPCWYCSRMVRDEHIRTKRGNGSRFTEDNQPPKVKPKSPPKVPPKPPFGDGPPSSSSSAVHTTTPRVALAPRDMIDPPPPVVVVGDEWSDAVPSGTAAEFDKIQSRINELHPSWKKRPQFSHKERMALWENRKAWMEVEEDDWKLLAKYMAVQIPDHWKQNPRDFPQPDNRLGLIGLGPTAALSYADRMEKNLKKQTA